MREGDSGPKPGGRELIIKKVSHGGQTAHIRGRALPPTSSVTLRAHITWADDYILICKMSIMTYHHQEAAVKIKCEIPVPVWGRFVISSLQSAFTFKKPPLISCQGRQGTGITLKS